VLVRVKQGLWVCGLEFSHKLVRAWRETVLVKVSCDAGSVMIAATWTVAVVTWCCRSNAHQQRFNKISLCLYFSSATDATYFMSPRFGEILDDKHKFKIQNNPTVHNLRPHAAFDNEICGRPHVIQNKIWRPCWRILKQYWSKTNARQENQSTRCVTIWTVTSQRVIEWTRNLCLN